MPLRRTQVALLKTLAAQSAQDFRSPNDFPAVRAFLYATEGKTREAEAEIQEAVRLGKGKDHFHHAAFLIAAAYAEMVKPHEAVQWLRRTSEIGMPNYPLFRDNPSTKKLAGNPEYQKFIGEYKPQWDQFAASLR